ncbi:BMP-binding endothelial regulator protein-like isoform X2 [Patiria miniata]|uniref:BMP-binding endothelial regulator protein n=1 Tax=Patiria miniata TaxID=46514 RepID=A0A913ZDZ4_PATMI|nr:BMP-binding endothelial regulator protein-like isoform X2 [Patiria miniata]
MFCDALRIDLEKLYPNKMMGIKVKWNSRELASLFKLLLFLWWVADRACGQLVGDRAKCDKEGEVVTLPILLGNPCIQCVCKNGVIICERETCPKLDQCALIFTSLGKSCCEKCKVCRYNGDDYTSGQRWSAHNDPCQQFECREGVLTASRTQCVEACSNPAIVPGECCPVCPECSFEGRRYAEGATVRSAADACVECTCKKSGLTCRRLMCPVLSCPKNQQKTLPGKCCPECAAPRKVFDLGHRCLFGSSVFDDGQNVLAEKCTKCVCLDSTVVCQRTICEAELDCPSGDVIHVEGECCPKCKPRACGYAGKVYQEGEMWAPHACETCQCVGGEAVCSTETCPATPDVCQKNHALRVPEGECCSKCIEKNALCSVFGDPHYRTFDGRLFNFQGTCKYILASDCADRTFTVRVRNEGRQTSSFAWTRTVFISILGHRVTLMQDYAVRVDKQEVALPYEVPEALRIRSDGFLIRVSTKIGLEVTWDGDSLVEVSMPPAFKNKVCGLCGNYNGNRLDDFQLRHGAVTTDPGLFAESWVSGNRDRCARAPSTTQSVPCGDNPKKRLRAHRECKVLRTEKFQGCTEVVDMWVYYRSCITDMCECPKHKPCYCEALRAFVRACQQEGVEVELDSTSTCTVQTCPEGAVFAECGTPCPRTCANKDEPFICERPCVAGCQCPDGLVMHRDRCIPTAECP